MWLPLGAKSYTVVRVSFRISTPDLLQNTKKATGESTVWFSCMVQCRTNLLPAYAVLFVGETMVTVGVGTVKEMSWALMNACVILDSTKTLHYIRIYIYCKYNSGRYTNSVHTEPPLLYRVYPKINEKETSANIQKLMKRKLQQILKYKLRVQN